jgi:predicted nucleic acid-binding protein
LYVVDASVWVSWFLLEDAFHDDSRTWFEHVRSQSALLIAPYLLLPELAGSVSRRTGDAALGRRSASLVATLPRTQLMSVGSELSERAARLAGDLSLKGADAIYAALAQRLVIPLVTWDAPLKARGATATPVKTPAELLEMDWPA